MPSVSEWVAGRAARDAGRGGRAGAGRHRGRVARRRRHLVAGRLRLVVAVALQVGRELRQRLLRRRAGVDAERAGPGAPDRLGPGGAGRGASGPPCSPSRSAAVLGLVLAVVVDRGCCVVGAASIAAAALYSGGPKPVRLVRAGRGHGARVLRVRGHVRLGLRAPRAGAVAGVVAVGAGRAAGLRHPAGQQPARRRRPTAVAGKRTLAVRIGAARDAPALRRRASPARSSPSWPIGAWRAGGAARPARRSRSPSPPCGRPDPRATPPALVGALVATARLQLVLVGPAGRRAWRCRDPGRRHRAAPSADRPRSTLLEGPAGWGECSPLPGYPCDPARAGRAAEEAAVRRLAGGRCATGSRSTRSSRRSRPTTAAGLAAGFAVREGQGGRRPGDDVDRVAAVRDAVGPRGRLRVDANGAWDVDTALADHRPPGPLRPRAGRAAGGVDRRPGRASAGGVAVSRSPPTSASRPSTTPAGSPRSTRPTCSCSRSSPSAGSPPPWPWPRPPACRRSCRRCSRRRWAWPPAWPWPPPSPTCPTPAGWARRPARPATWWPTRCVPVDGWLLRVRRPVPDPDLLARYAVAA